MILWEIIKACKNNTNISIINKSAKKLIQFVNGSKCTNAMKKAVIDRFGKIHFITYQQIYKGFSEDTQKSTKQLIRETIIALDLVLNHSKPYTYVTITTKNSNIIDANILTASKIIEIAQTMLATKDKNIYKRQQRATKQIVTKEITNSLQSKVSKKQVIQLALEQLFNDYEGFKIQNRKGHIVSNRYKTFIKNIQLLKSINESSDTKRTLKKISSIYNKHHNFTNKAIKSIVSKNHIQHILLQQIFHEAKHFDNSIKDNISKADNNSIEYIWDLLDDINVIKSIYKSSSRIWVKDLVTSDSMIVAYAPLVPFKFHVYNYHIDKYGQLKVNKDYPIIKFKRADVR